uniref:RING-type E3 ubiquitin transferase n=1 Tax=Ananas comosus var. bracteatus TaxID=296719 RepID=A0A6V7P9L0_ANACO|nr:unnamed protein product [Ananas comosus var. bracteatus]
MEEYSGRRSSGEIRFSKTASGISLRSQNLEEKNNQNCNKFGVGSSRINAVKSTQIDNLERPRNARASFRSTSSKAIVGSTSRSTSRKSHHEKQKQSVLEERNIAKNSGSSKAVIEYSEDSISNSGDSISNSTTEGFNSHKYQGISMHNVESSRRASSSSSSSSKQRNIELCLGSSSFGRIGSASKKVSLASKSSPGLKNLSCASVSDVLPSGCSSSDLNRSKRVEPFRKRASEGESSSRVKSLIGSSSRGIPGPCLPVPEQSASRLAARRTGNPQSSRDGAVSSGIVSASSEEPRVGVSDQRASNEEIPISIRETVPEISSRPFSRELTRALLSSGRRSSTSRDSQSRSTHRTEESGSSGDRSGHRRINMEGIAEVLLALDRIEQDELTYEQLLALEANFFLGGFNFLDQHRDMRMDIDNMSYEELLALEEKMGTVSTALSAEQLAKSLKRTIYVQDSIGRGISTRIVEDIKCSICQEEYVKGDELGTLRCKHRYHIVCAHQWFRLKNWCPICKASAAPS